MEDYEGPTVIRVPGRATRFQNPKAAERKNASQFSSLASPITGPMEGYAVVSVKSNIFDVPALTELEVSGPYYVTAKYIPVPTILDKLEASKLRLGKYNVEEIKGVLQLHGVHVPTGTRLKADYVKLAEDSGLVTEL